MPQKYVIMQKKTKLSFRGSKEPFMDGPSLHLKTFTTEFHQVGIHLERGDIPSERGSRTCKSGDMSENVENLGMHFGLFCVQTHRQHTGKINLQKVNIHHHLRF